MDIRGRGLIACFIYFLMLMWAECRRSPVCLQCVVEHRDPTADLTEDAGYRSASGHSSLPILCMRLSFIFNEGRARTGASLKRATLRLLAIRLNSRPLPLPFILTSKELGEFEKSRCSGEKSVLQSVCMEASNQQPEKFSSPQCQGVE